MPPDELPGLRLTQISVAAGADPAMRTDRVYCIAEDGSLWLCHKPNEETSWVWEELGRPNPDED